MKKCIILYLAMFLLTFVAIAGAWLGFWVVHKLVLTEDGSVDISTAQFVAWAIRILAVIMILQSSMDPLLGTLALLFIPLLRIMVRLKTLRRMSRHLFKSPKKNSKSSKKNRRSQVPELAPPFDDSPGKHLFESQNLEDSALKRSHLNSFNLAPCSSSEREELYPSIIHSTPERRKYSAAEWDAFTKESTEKALEELVASPDFGKWLSNNADRISVTPNSKTDRWLLWS